MKVIIAGPRTLYISVQRIDNIVKNSGFHITELVSGCAEGIDTCGIRWADFYKVPVDKHPYQSEFGKAGGPRRNAEMAEVADALIVIKLIDYETNGTSSMIREAEARGLPIHKEEIW